MAGSQHLPFPMAGTTNTSPPSSLSLSLRFPPPPSLPPSPPATSWPTRPLHPPPPTPPPLLLLPPPPATSPLSSLPSPPPQTPSASHLLLPFSAPANHHLQRNLSLLLLPTWAHLSLFSNGCAAAQELNSSSSPSHATAAHLFLSPRVPAPPTLATVPLLLLRPSLQPPPASPSLFSELIPPSSFHLAIIHSVTFIPPPSLLLLQTIATLADPLFLRHRTSHRALSLPPPSSQTILLWPAPPGHRHPPPSPHNSTSFPPPPWQFPLSPILPPTLFSLPSIRFTPCTAAPAHGLLPTQSSRPSSFQASPLFSPVSLLPPILFPASSSHQRTVLNLSLPSFPSHPPSSRAPPYSELHLHPVPPLPHKPPPPSHRNTTPSFAPPPFSLLPQIIDAHLSHYHLRV